MAVVEGADAAAEDRAGGHDGEHAAHGVDAGRRSSVWGLGLCSRASRGGDDCRETES